MATLERTLNALIIIVISGVLLGAFGVQVFMHEEPCPLCFLQRLGMIGVASSLLLNVWFGIQASHYGLAIISSLMGGSVALRQISLHVCPGFTSFGLPVMGLSLYTWSFFVFACCVLSVGLLLCLYEPRKSGERPLRLNFWEKTASYLIFFVAFGNILAAFLQCGFGVCHD